MGSGPEGVIQTILQILTGNLALGAIAVAIVWQGYLLLFTDRGDGARFAKVLIGGAIILGGRVLTDRIYGGGGGGFAWLASATGLA